MLAANLSEIEALFKLLVQHALADDSAPKRWHITRLALYKALEGCLTDRDGVDKRLLSISYSEPLAEICGLRQAQVTKADYPQYDFCNLDVPDGAFDFMVSDQILEHVPDPARAMRESARVLKPGGIAVHTTCFMNQLHHAAPEDEGDAEHKDYFRFTLPGLKTLAAQAGLQTIQTGGRGNRLMWTYIAMGYRGQKIPENPKNPLYQLAMLDEPSVPLSVWLIARKPL
jgi:SAM-dependent methyltransferase